MMPSPLPLRCDEDVVAYVARTCFKTGPPGPVGAELEWLVQDPRHPQAPPPLDEVRAALLESGPLPGGSPVSYEPGGQLELSSLPAADVSACWRALSADVAHIQGILADLGLQLEGYGLDPHRPPVRLVYEPRYDAMETVFGADGSPGMLIMCSSAGVQVCLNCGDDPAQRWRLAHLLGPVFVAAFANSPLREGRPTGWRSTRQALWQAMDPVRTRPPEGADPVAAWAEYALAAPVMLLRRPGPWLVDPGLTFRQWVHGARPARADPLPAPTEDDLAYHLTTLFPPVRPQGYLELRTIDAQSVEHWPVPVAVATALLDDPAAAARAEQAAEPVAGRWQDAARCALTDPALAGAAQECFAAALDGLPRLGADAQLIGLVAAFADRYVDRGRTPADDLLAPERTLAWS